MYREIDKQATDRKIHIHIQMKIVRYRKIEKETERLIERLKDRQKKLKDKQEES